MDTSAYGCPKKHSVRKVTEPCWVAPLATVPIRHQQAAILVFRANLDRILAGLKIGRSQGER
jgi:hypothetical protein